MASPRPRGLTIAAAALIAFAGCDGPQAPIAQAGGPESSRSQHAKQTAGGIFNATFSGTYTTACGQYGSSYWEFRGAGRASFLGASREHGRMSLKFSRGCIIESGTGTLTSKRSGDKIRVTFQGASYPPCGGSGAVAYIVRGGTGKFLGATGSGTVTFACTFFSSQTYTDTWTGSLYY
ncbi:MAG TPA: hypothetical protein VEW74_06760 [Candidatus Nitrosotalea sp.]|nr:hypothetical protein [Candidatus Nitrosotalea sp.]